MTAFTPEHLALVRQLVYWANGENRANGITIEEAEAIRALIAEHDELADKVIESRAAIPSNVHSGVVGYAAACDRADRAEAERDAQDAKRYRWLRARNGQWIIVIEEPEDKQLYEDALDAAIDAAMGAADEGAGDEVDTANG